MGGDVPSVQILGKEVGHLAVPVDHKDLLGGRGKVLDPGEQVVPVRVGGEPLEVDDAGVDGDLLAEQLHRLGPLQQPPAQGALRLIAHKHHGALGAPQVVLQMVADAPGVAHAGGGDDDLGAAVHVQSLGLLGGLDQGEAGEGEQVVSPLEDLNGLLVQIAP